MRLELAPQEGTRARKPWVRALIGVGILAGILVLALVAFVVAGFVRESRALEAVRARGEPLAPSEITFAGSPVRSDLASRVDQHAGNRTGEGSEGRSDALVLSPCFRQGREYSPPGARWNK